jgi:ABC-2 type transport system permease protein
MIGSIAAELLKLRKRPAVWLTGASWLVVNLFFSYLVPYLFYRSPTSGPGGTVQVDRSLLLAPLLPQQVITALIPTLTFSGAAIALILAVLAVGSEYDWDMHKVLFTQRAERLPVFAGKLLALGLVLGVFILVVFAGGIIASLCIAITERAAVDWPSLGMWARGIGTIWLILSVWALFGVLLATLFRGVALALGLSLIYALVIEGLLAGILDQVGRLRVLREALLSTNVNALTADFRALPKVGGQPPALVTPDRAALVLSCYALAFLLIAALLVLRRDVP